MYIIIVFENIKCLATVAMPVSCQANIYIAMYKCVPTRLYLQSVQYHFCPFMIFISMQLMWYHSLQCLLSQRSYHWASIIIGLLGRIAKHFNLKPVCKLTVRVRTRFKSLMITRGLTAPSIALGEIRTPNSTRGDTMSHFTGVTYTCYLQLFA